MDSFDMIDRYVAEVGRNLPRKSRLDIEAEILSALEDMLAERSRKTGRAVDEQMIAEVLKEYGSPRKVAASYQPERYVIGPLLFTSFLTAVQVILPIVAAIALVRMGISLGQVNPTAGDVFKAVFLGMAGFISTSFTALGGLLALFAIVQWALPGFKEDPGEWEPSKLPQATARDRLEAGITLLEVFGCCLAIVIFNFYPQTINTGIHTDGSWWIALLNADADKVWSTTILSDTFFSYLPTLTILWALTILLDIGLLSRGRWETWSRWSAFGLKVMAIALAGMMVAGPAVIAVSTDVLMAAGFPDTTGVQMLINGFQQGAIVLLAATIMGNAIGAIRLLVRLTGRNLTPTLEKFAHP